MSPRTGRPTDNPKKTRLELRLSNDDTEKLEYCHQETGLSNDTTLTIQHTPKGVCLIIVSPFGAVVKH